MSQRYQAAILSASFNGLKAPDAPTIGTATAGAGSASVAFTAPANVGGSAITGYTVISSPGSIIGTGASSPVTVSGLTNGTAYTFTVVATNAYGTGPASAASNSVTPVVNYIESVFSTWLYTGNGTTQTITNGINLATKGGLVWQKDRVSAGQSHILCDTARGVNSFLRSDLTSAAGNNGGTDAVYAFNSNGFSTGTVNGTSINLSGDANVSWTFAKQPKFFDVVTYTGNGVLGNTIAHNLQSVPGCIIWKRLDSTSAWGVWHIGSGITTSKNGGSLNSTNAFLYTLNATPYQTSTTFSPAWVNDAAGNNGNTDGASYVAYLFARNAGGVGATNTDNVITCGSYTGTSSPGNAITLGYEPQWLMVKNTTENSTDWVVYDNMRGMPYVTANSSLTRILNPNTSGAEDGGYSVSPTATGFEISTTHPNVNNTGKTYIYIAIRKGPMAVPTVGTTAFSPIAYTGNSTSNTTVQNLTTNFAGDATLIVPRNNPQNPFFADKLRGNVLALYTSLTRAQENFSTARPGQSIGFNNTQTVLTGQFTAVGTYNYSGDTIVSYNLQRAPSVFDEVILSSGTTTYNHNLTVSPELILVKCTDAAGANWVVYSKSLSNPTTDYLVFNGVNATQTHGAGAWAVSSTQFSVDPGLWANGSVGVSYLFATAAGVSKVGSYTGTGALITVDCGFTTGARFVLIKRTDSTGDWYVWDSARGITSGNDPFSNTNTATVETTGTNYVDTTGVGFQVTAAASTTVNISSGTYIFLAIA
jgi:hypothetical protein